LFRASAFIATLLGASQVFAQSQALTKINVVAAGPKGAPVTDLTAGDFQVRVDGKLCPVVFARFAGSKHQLAQPEPQEFVNHPGPPLTAILLDRWNETESTMVTAWQDVANAVGHLETLDRVYIYYIANRGEVVPVYPLPGVEADLHAVEPPPAAALVSKLNETVRTLTGLRDMVNVDPAERADRTLQGLGIVGRMAAIDGPKNLVWVTHGFPIQFVSSSGQLMDYTGLLLGLAQNAGRAQVAIYTVDQSALGAGADVAGLSRQTLELLSAQSGGRWYASGRAAEALAGVSADARGTYQLAYYAPSNPKGPRDHKLRVESSRKGLRLLARAGYSGDEVLPDPDESSDDAFTRQSHSPFEATEIGLRVAVSRKAAALHLEIHIDRADVFLEHKGDRYQGSLTLKFAEYRDGVFQGARPSFQQDLNLTQEQYDAALKDGIVIPRDLSLTGQIEQVRVMVFDRGAQGLGSVVVPVR
jgi:VWFA-related protein